MADLVRKGFLQACLNHGTLTIAKTNNILKALCEAHDERTPSDLAELKAYIKELNGVLQKLDQCLVFAKHPLCGQEEVLVFTCTLRTQNTKLLPHYSELERHYFSKLIETIVKSENYGVHWMAIYSAADCMNASKKLQKPHVQELVAKWTSQGYILEKDDQLYPGPRMIIEYESYLCNQYPALAKKCPLCVKIVLWDVVCSDCRTRIHRECIRKYLTKKSHCPSCKKIWNTRLSL